MNKSMDCKQFVKVKCDWVSNVDGLNIENCVAARLHQSESGTVDVDIIDLIEKYNCNCVNFLKPGDNDLFINISCDSNHLIREVFICSEAKTIELYGKNGEYLSTHPAFSLEDVNELTMNSHLVPINRTECSFKLEQLQNSEFVWIYGILVYLTETEERPNKYLGPINMQNVHQLMNSESLTTNALKLFSSLSLKESKSNDNDFVTSILSNLTNTKFSENNCDGKVLNNFKQFEKNVEDKLNSLALQLNTIGDNVEILNKKFNMLLSVLHEKKMI